MISDSWILIGAPTNSLFGNYIANEVCDCFYTCVRLNLKLISEILIVMEGVNRGFSFTQPKIIVKSNTAIITGCNAI